MPNPIDVPGNIGFSIFIDGKEVEIENLPKYAEFFEALQPINDPISILMLCEDNDEAEGYTRGTSLKLYQLYLRITH